MHGDVVGELDESVGAGDEIGFAIDFDEHTDFSAGVDVASNETFGGFARGFFRGSGLALFAQHADGFLDVAVGFNERRAAIGEARVGALAQLFHELRRNLYLTWLCAHALISSR